MMDKISHETIEQIIEALELTIEPKTLDDAIQHILRNYKELSEAFLPDDESKAMLDDNGRKRLEAKNNRMRNRWLGGVL